MKHHELCDVNDVNPEGIRKPCNCGGNHEDDEERYCDGEGPECPACGRCYTADDGHYYDESRTFEIQCRCGAIFEVQPEVSVSWTTWRKAQPAAATNGATEGAGPMNP